MKYAFVRDHAEEWPVKAMCQTLEVSTSGYYGWRRKPFTRRYRDDAIFRAVIRQYYDDFDGRYGSPRICVEMNATGYRINHKRVERLMREMGLSARPPKQFVNTTDSNHDGPIAPNLLEQDFSAEKPDDKWVGDITYVPTDEGWLFLAVVLDLYSRRIVGWAFADTLHRDIVLQAMQRAIQQRRPPPGLIFHSDRGCQYASEDFRNLLNRHGIVQSMSATGNCYDNAVAESFFHTLKVEEVHRRIYRTRTEAQTALFAYIEGFYNHRRRHSSLGYLSPGAFEEYNHAA